MLVLGRKENETILIGDKIRITIVGRAGSSIKIGVDAPGDIKVLRGELVGERLVVASTPTAFPAATN